MRLVSRLSVFYRELEEKKRMSVNTHICRENFRHSTYIVNFRVRHKTCTRVCNTLHTRILPITMASKKILQTFGTVQTYSGISSGNCAVLSIERKCLKIKEHVRRLCGQRVFYRVSIKSFPDYKHLLQENYVEYKHMQL